MRDSGSRRQIPTQVLFVMLLSRVSIGQWRKLLPCFLHNLIRRVVRKDKPMRFVDHVPHGPLYSSAPASHFPPWGRLSPSKSTLSLQLKTSRKVPVGEADVRW